MAKHFVISLLLVLFSVQVRAQDSLRISVTAVDLSEDMSRLSSQKDELMVLVYADLDSGELKAPITLYETVLDTSRRKESWSVSIGEQELNNGLHFFLLEMDSDRPASQIDPVVRIHYSELISAFRNRDYNSIKEYLNDEDMLGYRRVNSSSLGTNLDFSFKGVHRLDEYEYRLRLHF